MNIERVGIVSWDDGQGDATFYICNEERWNYIFGIECKKSKFDPRWNEQFSSEEDIENWRNALLEALESEKDKDIFPGKILKRVHAQNGVFEYKESVVSGPYIIIGFLSLCFS